ncbi:hypothetical protein AGRA3207_005284 [Actinomadura graeca]|uniref:NERD domain-containing protein n=1 Tax=Actinomadura graeca TaxID=2750812 RepID=A0ABX8R241_9ACTN|nr:DUF6585 family protein [Actinomadura graeca]QXJ24037.1 hypothetical protein AGRA3207_005284 [Actinomadura graeca]
MRQEEPGRDEPEPDEAEPDAATAEMDDGTGPNDSRPDGSGLGGPGPEERGGADVPDGPGTAGDTAAPAEAAAGLAGWLGEPGRVFDGRTARRRVVGWLALLGVAAAMLVPAAIIYLGEGEWWLGVPAALLAAAYASGTAWIVGSGGLRGRDRVVRLFKGGLVVREPGGGARDTGDVDDVRDDRNAAYAWDDLVSVTVSGVRRRRRTRWSVTVVARDGRVLRFGDELPDVEILGEAVAGEVTARQVPRYLAVVRAGEPVRLGPFTVDLDGLEKEGERVPWHAVRDVVIDGGVVLVRAPGDRTALAAIAGHMPDALAFVALCSQVKALDEGPR